MSIDLMNRLWWRDFDPEVEPIQETHPGSGKNLAWALIAMADMASDDGFCWPAVETIARKARLSVRATQMALRQAEKIGILRKRDRRDASSQYVFVIDAMPHVERPSRAKERGPLDSFDEPEPDLFGTGAGGAGVKKRRVQGVRGTGAWDSLTGAGDAPRNVRESEENPQPSSDDLLCRFVEEEWGTNLRLAYPDLPPMPPMTEARARAIARRADEHAGKRPDHEARLAVWKTAFEVVRSSKLLLGLKTDWSCSVDWLLTRKNFGKVIARQYGNGHDRVGTAGRQDRSAVEAGHEALDLVRSHRSRSGGPAAAAG